MAAIGGRSALGRLFASLRWVLTGWLTLSAFAGLAQAAPLLRVLAWPGYADADVVAQFEKRHGVRVEVTIVSSDEALRSQMLAEVPTAEAPAVARDFARRFRNAIDQVA